MNKLLDKKQAQRLLKILESDPRLQAPDDATILSDEQYPIAFDAAVLRLKDPISVTSTVAILGWNRESKDHHLAAQDRERLIKQQDTVHDLHYFLLPLVIIPWMKSRFSIGGIGLRTYV